MVPVFLFCSVNIAEDGEVGERETEKKPYVQG
jgi:hypothetical protein